MKKTKFFLTVLWICFLANLVQARYYNHFQYILGERAAGMAGAYTALANDSTALWYNPAGLADIKNDNINISGSTYNYITIKSGSIVEFPKQGGGYSAIELKESSFTIIANTLVYGKNVGEGQGLAFGIFIPYQDSIVGSIEEVDLSVGADLLSTKGEFIRNSKFYVGMLGYGFQLGNFNIGISLGLGYRQRQFKENMFMYLRYGADESLVTTASDLNSDQFTLQNGFGLQYKMGNHQLGFFIQPPVWNIYGKAKIKEVEIVTDSAGYDASDDSWPAAEEENIDAFKQVMPAFAVLGYAYSKPNSFSLSVDIEGIAKLKGGGRDSNKLGFNIKLGAEFFITDHFIFRAGAFTDLSQADDVEKSDEDSTDKIDYYGGTLSFSIAKNFITKESKKEEKKTLWSTVGFSIRYGIGEVKITRFNVSGGNFVPTAIIKEKTVIHFSAFIAESLSF